MMGHYPAPPEEDYEDEEEDYEFKGKKNNAMPFWGNAQNMNLNPLIMTNIQNSPYFKGLLSLKTYHQVIDEIYYKVDHMEPWERGSRKTSGQTGMCGGVRGVGAGGTCVTNAHFQAKLTVFHFFRQGEVFDVFIIENLAYIFQASSLLRSAYYSSFTL